MDDTKRSGQAFSSRNDIPNFRQQMGKSSPCGTKEGR
ncbi:hypothetical protein A2U01_0051421, partial [Trifolium medium]|nr:hypothetical protein [Trifolium medium]